MCNTHTSRWLCLLTSVLLVGNGWSAGLGNPGATARLKPASGVTTLFHETFEGAGYLNATTEDVSTADEDDATSPPEGSQNLKITYEGGNGAYPTAAWSAASVITMTGWFRVSAVGSYNYFITITATPNATPRGYLAVTAAGKLSIVGNGAGSVSADTVDSVSTDTWYAFKAKWNKTAETASVEFNVSGTFNDAGNDYASVTSTGDSGTTMGDFKYEVNGAAAYVTRWDDITVTTP